MASDNDDERDSQIRSAAFEQLRRLTLAEGILDRTVVDKGFTYEDMRWPYWNRQRGIFKRAGLPYLLSIRTVVPKKGARVWYDDQREVHEQIYRGADHLDYAFMGTDPHAADNQWLRQAAERQVPIIYFLGVAPAAAASGFVPRTGACSL